MTTPESAAASHGNSAPAPHPHGAAAGAQPHGGHPLPPQDPAHVASFYEAVGGEETFRQLVHRFYEQVRVDPLIGPMYPHDDWEGAEARLRWFLIQYWGGPTTFSDNRGHPRLRMRHNHFQITPAAAVRWLEMMKISLDEIPAEVLDEQHRAAVWEHMERVAYMLINRPAE